MRFVSRSPNIVYFVCHDIGRHMGCYGAQVQTPCLDAFAREGTIFNRAFCNSPACSPSRACAMTGQYAHSTGAVGLSHMGWPLDLRHRTIVDALNDADYETVLSGVNHERHPRTDRYQVDLTRTWDDWKTERAVRNALDYLKARDCSRPFYLNIGSQQPHASTWHLADDLHGGVVPPEDVWMPPYCADTPATRGQFGRFQAAIRYMDRHFGALLEGLDSLGLTEDTVVVFTTDHGIAVPRSKGTLYERGVEIALLVRLPGADGAGRRVDPLVQNIDFAPTLLELAGAPVPPEMQGRSFRALLTDGAYTPHEAIFAERNFHGERAHRGAEGYVDRYDPVRAIRTPDFHYIRWFRPDIKPRPLLPWEVSDAEGGIEGKLPDDAWPASDLRRNPEELYHVAIDPQEFVNVADRPEYRHIKSDLADRLSQWMRDTGDFALQDDPPPRPEPPGWGPGWPASD
jgi:N-sulfoglucosamine sulfohydrolase